jgi:hypothetical protein
MRRTAVLLVLWGGATAYAAQPEAAPDGAAGASDSALVAPSPSPSRTPGPAPTPVPAPPAAAPAAPSTPAGTRAHGSPGDSLATAIATLAARGEHLPADTRRVFDELLAAARELLAEGDVEAAGLVLDDARALVRDESQ